MSEQPIAERIRELANDLDDAVDRAKRAVIFPAADTTPGAEYRAAFAGLYAEMDLRATIAHEIALDAEASAPPTRPLEAVLADIVAEGRQVQLSVHADGHAYLSTWVAAEKATDEAADWRHNDGDDPVELAEAGLADIRKLHAEKAANPLVGLDLTPAQVRENIERALTRQDPAAAVEAVQRDADADAEAMLEQGETLVHFSLLIPERIVCGATEGAAVSMPEQGVTCPACAAWVREHLVGYDDFPGPEEADSETATARNDDITNEEG